MLEPLFDTELDYRPEMEPIADDGDGVLVGSGDGLISGPRLNGKLEWTLFEEPRETICRMTPIARITTDDGAEIGFEGRGFAIRSHPGNPRWRVAATLRFTTDDARYAWLDSALGLWEGEFDSTTHHARYQAFFQRDQGA